MGVGLFLHSIAERKDKNIAFHCGEQKTFTISMRKNTVFDSMLICISTLDFILNNKSMPFIFECLAYKYDKKQMVEF